MRVVFMPSNRRMRDVIVTHTHLIDDAEMPPVLTDFLAHVAAYEIVFARWDGGDHTDQFAMSRHPGQPLADYIRTSFTRIKARQQALLGVPRVRSDRAARDVV